MCDLRQALLSLIVAIACTNCTGVPHHCAQVPTTKAEYCRFLRDHFQRVFYDDSSLGIVFETTTQVTQSAPAVLVLHEYPNLGYQCLDFAYRLSKQGFDVYVPLLFGHSDGEAGSFSTLQNSMTLAFSPDWHVFFGEHSHQGITDRLRRLCRRIELGPRRQRHWRHRHVPYGIVSDCLNGPAMCCRPCCCAAGDSTCASHNRGKKIIRHITSRN